MDPTDLDCLQEIYDLTFLFVCFFLISDGAPKFLKEETPPLQEQRGNCDPFFCVCCFLYYMFIFSFHEYTDGHSSDISGITDFLFFFCLKKITEAAVTRDDEYLEQKKILN